MRLVRIRSCRLKRRTTRERVRDPGGGRRGHPRGSRAHRGLAIGPETRLVEELDLDSIDLVGVTMRLEDRFHVEIDVQDIKHFRCVSDLMAQLSGDLGKSAA